MLTIVLSAETARSPTSPWKALSAVERSRAYLGFRRTMVVGPPNWKTLGRPPHQVRNSEVYVVFLYAMGGAGEIPLVAKR